MQRPKAQKVLFVAMAVALAGFFVWGFIPEPVLIQTDFVKRGPMHVTVSDDGRTRVRELYTVSAPLSGRLLRLEREVGDKVVKGETPLALLQSAGPAFLDKRRQQEAEAQVDTAKAALTVAQADVERMIAEVDYARQEIKRVEALVATETASPAMLDKAKLGLRSAIAQLEAARSAVRLREADLAAAEAALIGPDGDTNGTTNVVTVRSPIDGVVLSLLHESEGIVTSGTPLLEVGDQTDIEIVADFLSTDAVKVSPGAPVIIEGWGGPALRGNVRLVEPMGFTKISALGIEEQRVNIIIDFDESSKALAARMGHGFRVEPKIVLWQDDDVLQVPSSAIFRSGPSWAVFLRDGNRAYLRQIAIDHINDVTAEVVSGLKAGDEVVLHPSESLEDGSRISLRPN